MTARVGAVHLGWDVVSVAAGGGGSPIRPVLVEGSYTPPAYLLADSSGRLHTAGVDRRPDVGIAISDVRDIIGHPQIVVAGATWPAELVFRARMHNPLASVVEHLGTTLDVLALPFPDEWPDPKVDEFVRLVEQLGVPAEPLPESVALSGYVRALGLVRAPGRGPAVGAVGVYSDGRECLVVAVHGNDDQPTESVSVAITAEALHEAHAADNVVIEVMAAARAINADTSTVLLTGNVCFNDALRLAFQNHLGHRFQVADHPMHALVLGATHLLVADSEGDPAYDRPRPAAGQQAGSAQQAGTAGQQAGSPQQAGAVGQQSGSEQQPGGADGRPIEQGPRHVSGGPVDRPLQRQPEPLAQQPELVPRHMDSPPAPESATQRPGSAPRTGPQPAADAGKPAGGDSEGRTRRLTAEEAAAVAALTKGSTSGRPADPAAEGLTRRITAQDAAAQGSATGNTGPGGITQRVTAAELARLTQTGAGEPDRNAAAAAGTSPSGEAGQGVTRGTEGASTGGQPVAGGRGTLPPGLEGVGGRFMRPPGSPADDQMTTVFGPGDQGGPGSGHQGGAGSGRQGYAASTHAADGGYGPGAAGAQQGSGSAGAQQGQGAAGTYGAGGQGGYGQGQSGGAFGPGGQVQGGYGQPGAYGPGEPQAAAGQFGPGTGGPGSTGGSGYGAGYGSANAAGSDGSAQGGYGPGGAQQGPGGQYGAQQGPGGQYNQGGYGPGGYGAQGGYTTGGYPAGPYGPEGDTSGSGRGSFAGSGGNAPGQPGAMYGGSMSSGVRGSNPQAPEDAAGQSDSDSGSGSEGERKPRKGKLWGKMRKPFGAPIVVGAAALSLLGAHSDQRATVAAESVPPASSMTSTASGTASGTSTAVGTASGTSVAPWTASGVVARATAGEVRPVGDSCAMTPFVSGLPGSGVATIGDPQSLECLRLGIDTLRYTLPGPVRGIDPGPPLHI
ncbi:hypothetical protein ACFYUD_11300 [Nocardia tengchongensis]|uniref:hypothetical protein n=1 Tax=Nocardia tengchongensis TaxID=2055889 RepID=UPI003683059E